MHSKNIYKFEKSEVPTKTKWWVIRVSLHKDTQFSCPRGSESRIRKFTLWGFCAGKFQDGR